VQAELNIQKANFHVLFFEESINKIQVLYQYY